jgi:hypothetical protein
VPHLAKLDGDAFFDFVVERTLEALVARAAGGRRRPEAVRDGPRGKASDCCRRARSVDSQARERAWRVPVTRRLAGIAGAALLAIGCASVPAPKGEVANADLALRKAEAVNAAEIAPLDARLAREKLERARLELNEENYLEARRLAEEAEVDALVAEAKARSARSQRAAQEIRDQIDALRAEADRAAERVR